MTPRRIDAVSWIAAALVLLALGAGAGYWWANSTQPQVETTASGERKVLYWHDPMVPNAKFDKPGKSPFMDMQLVPVYADEAGDEAGVRVSARVAQNLGIRIGRVEKVAMPEGLQAVGSVTFDENLLEVVQARVEGYVTRLHVKTPLELVRRGQPLAEILAPQWLEAEQEYLALLDARAPSVQSIREAARQRLVVLGVPESTIRAIETTRTTGASTTLFAPIDGAITELGVREGTTFMPGAVLFRVSGLESVWVNAQIPEAQISSVPAGSSVDVRATAWPGKTFKGKVIALLPELDRETRTVTARVAIQNPQDQLVPGMFVSLDFTAPPGEPQLVVPSEAVIVTGERSVVIVARASGALDVVDVTVGIERAGRSAILSGLTEGESVVVSGQFLIDSEASLKSTINRLEASSEEGP